MATQLDTSQKMLLKQLARKQAQFNLLERYYDGDAPLPEGAEGQSRSYRRFQRKARLNLAQLSVVAVRERMVIGGFRTGADDDDNGDREARRLWKANHLDYLSADLHSTFLRFGTAYALVGYPDGSEYPVVTVEDPRQMLARTSPTDPHKILEAVRFSLNTVCTTLIFTTPTASRSLSKTTRPTFTMSTIGSYAKICWPPIL